MPYSPLDCARTAVSWRTFGLPRDPWSQRWPDLFPNARAVWRVMTGIEDAPASRQSCRTAETEGWRDGRCASHYAGPATTRSARPTDSSKVRTPASEMPFANQFRQHPSRVRRAPTRAAPRPNEFMGSCQMECRCCTLSTSSRDHQGMIRPIRFAGERGSSRSRYWPTSQSIRSRQRRSALSHPSEPLDVR